MTVRDLVLLADDDPFSREFLQEALQSFGCEVHAVEDGEAALAELGRRAFDFVVTDLKMPRADGQAVLVEAKRRDPDLPVILVTANGTLGVAVAAMRAGADDVLEKPVELQDLEVVLQRIRERRRLLRQNRFFRDESIGRDLVVAGPALQTVVDLVARVANSRATVLVRGESGTGKERIAALVHRLSDRANEPFVKLNCAAVPESLLESELFGHEAGAFTGASKRREGRFELADRGTLFLDEVSEMSPAMQSKLLRVLQEGEFERVGGNRTLRVDVRVVAATNRDLERDVASGRFRGDLYYRLAVVPVVLPPLRERPDEIVPLARHFLRPGLTLAPAAEELLRQSPWPGNVRELQNVVERAGLLCEGTAIEAATLAAWLGPAGKEAAQPATPAGTPAGTLPAAVLTPHDPFAVLVGRPLQAVEHELIQKTLAQCDGNRTRTAELLGISVRSLFDRLKSATVNR